MEHIPEDIEKYLVKDEIVEKCFNLSGCNVYASNKRLFIKRGNIVRDIDYGHISSIEFKAQRSWGAVGGGIFSIVLGLILVRWFGGPGYIPVIIGVVLVIAGLVRGEEIELAVVGLAIPLKLSGQRSALDSLFKLVREKRT